MRVSLAWLSEYVKINVPPRKLAELLTVSGTKVEAIHSPGQGIEGVVVAEVLGIVDHPNADNLTLVDVSTGGTQERVVCGARNFAVGDKVPYATVGARLPELEISERKIRGEVSRGMLASAAELGVSKDHSGILVLPDDAAPGADVVAVLGLDDTILELEITPNRPDCLGMIGIAREVAAVLDHDLVLPDTADPSGMSAAGVTVRLEDTAACPRYVAYEIDNVTVGASVGWVAARLIAAGIRPISDVVDATNYVLMETGQPLHAFDAATIHDSTIVVRRARSGEGLRTLDGVDRKLTVEDLVIADPRGALALAGVMGGETSEVGAATTSVVLESAHFDAATIAYMARRHGLRTEASYRFERGTDPEICASAAARCAAFIAETAAGATPAAMRDENPTPFEREVIRLRPARTSKILGAEVAPEVQERRLTSVGFSVARSGPDMDVEVPGFRPDVTREIDLVEEVARLGGYDILPSTLPPGVAGGLERHQAIERAFRRQLVGFGLVEAWTSSLASGADADALRLPHDHAARRAVLLDNPMIEQEDRMRTTLLPGLLRSVARNVAHRADGVALFELSRVYEPVEGERLPVEALHLGVLCSGTRMAKGWRVDDRGWDFFALKGVLDALAGSFGLEAFRYDSSEGMPFHPTRAARVGFGSHVVGAIGELHPDVCDAFDVPEGTVALEVACDPLVAQIPDRVAVGDLPRFPATKIDLAVVVAEATAAEDVARTIRDAGVPELIAARLFDVYRGDQVPAGHKSLAYALELRVADRTLTDADANSVRDRIVAALSERHGGELRS